MSKSNKTKMRKSLIFSIATLAVLSAPLFADDNITASGEEAEIIRNLHKQENLNHLFENSKFPVDDYIYKAGTRQPNTTERQEDIGEILKKMEEQRQRGIEPTPPTPQGELPRAMSDLTPEQIQARQQAQQERAMQRQAELQAKQESIKRQIRQDKEISYEAKMKQMMRAQILANRNSGVHGETKNSSQYGVDSFTNQKSVDTSTNEHKLYRTIRAGRMIPAILTSAISSDLSGIVTAQIEQDIYATMGRAVLIPRGSKAIGFYTSDTKLGIDRLQIMWQEIITPQGINIKLTNAMTADNMGMNGSIGAINNKYWERYGIAYSISTITNALMLGIASKINTNGSANNNYASEIYSSARSDIGTIVQEIMNQQAQIQPTIEIRSASRIFLVPTNHMWFAKPKNSEVLMQYFND